MAVYKVLLSVFYMNFFLGIWRVHSARYFIGYSPTCLIAFIQNLLLSKIQFN